MQTLTQPTFDTMRKNPTLEDVVRLGAEIDLPEHECEKLFHYYESVGWVIGKARTPFKSLRSVVSGWKIRWKERNANNASHARNSHTLLTKAQEIAYSKELERVNVRLDDVEYNGKQYGWTPKLIGERNKWRSERLRLRKLLGIQL